MLIKANCHSWRIVALDRVLRAICASMSAAGGEIKIDGGAGTGDILGASNHMAAGVRGVVAP